ncbi:MAG: hypothetical protein JO270_19970 [Acidobacteriaceae bacterium]|nr:hypothetical protein [Acidobacteriaceae bacterium]
MSGPSSPAADPGWPRSYSDGAAALVLYQPQIDDWPSFKTMKARFALRLTPAKGAQPVWGVLFIQTETRVDFASRTVAFSGWSITGIHFSGSQEKSQLDAWQVLTKKLLPAFPAVVAVERVLPYIDPSRIDIRETAVALDPPPILVTTQPALMMIIDGQPVARDIKGTSLQKIVNTNWDLFFDKEVQRYYLRAENSWYSATALNNKWTPVGKLPNSFSRLPDTGPYKDARDAAANPVQTRPMTIYVVNKPHELIELDGEPTLQQIPNTKLEWVANTECDLFFDTASRRFFFLTSGRWFSAADLKSGDWKPATDSLPQDFKHIPPHHPRGRVLASIPGTPEAADAVVLAAIPITAAINRHTARATVRYAGTPQFISIPGTGVDYARNTPNEVLRVGQRYYLCLKGVWFVSDDGGGPWSAADTIPDEIYTIPPDSPKYNVTFVKVYSSTAETVTYGYTAGYLGTYIAHGVAMWGTGFAYPSYIDTSDSLHPVYWSYPYYTYGSSAWYNALTGTYLRGTAFYGPYGGYARAAAYNPATMEYQWGPSAWAGYGAAAEGGVYDAATGGWTKAFHFANLYEGLAEAAAARPKKTSSAPALTSPGVTPIGVLANPGQVSTSSSSPDGDVYAGKDGNVYRRNASGQWDQNNGKSWQAMTQAAWNETVQSSPIQNPESDDVQAGLNHDASARAQGNLDAQQSQSARNSTNWSAGGWVEPLATGYSVRWSW